MKNIVNMAHVHLVTFVSLNILFMCSLTDCDMYLNLPLQRLAVCYYGGEWTVFEAVFYYGVVNDNTEMEEGHENCNSLTDEFCSTHRHQHYFLSKKLFSPLGRNYYFFVFVFYCKNILLVKTIKSNQRWSQKFNPPFQGSEVAINYWCSELNA